MSDVEERLRLADPLAGASYVHGDADAMVSRIITHYPRRRVGLLRSFQVKVAGSATLAAVLTVGAIAAINGAAPSFAVLAIGSTSHAKSDVPASSVGGAMAVFARYQFHAGDTLSADPATTSSYQLQVPGDPSSEAQRVAAIFGVSGAAVDTNGDGSDWTVGSGTGPTLDYQNNGGVPQWYFTSSSSPAATTTSTSAATGPAVSNDVVAADAQRYLQQLGYDFTVTDPQFSTSTITTTDPASTSNQATVSYTVVVDGISSDQSVSFTVDENNQLVDASGPSFHVSSSTDYPLISPTDGVATLNAQQAAEFASSGTDQSSQDSSSTTPVVTPPTTATTTPGSSAPGSSGSVGSSDTTTTVVAGPPIIDVTLNDASVSLQTYDTTDGSVWMLPVYEYTGTFNATDGSLQTSTWSLLAVQPAYVDVSASTTPIAY